MNKSTEWIPKALRHPRMSLGLASSRLYVIDQDKLDQKLETRVMTLADGKIKAEEN
jgi:hypothetical protein